MYSAQDLFLSVSIAVYLATSLIIVAVRYGHMCEPYSRYPKYYYPARKVLIFSFLSNILLLPVVFLPEEADSVLQLRMMLILASPCMSTLLLFSYFGNVLKVSWWRRPVYYLIVTYILMAGAAFVMTLMPGTQLVYGEVFCKCFFSVTGILAALYMCSYFMALRLMVRAMRKGAEENFSNVADFPNQYAKRVLWIPIAHVLVSWAATFSANPPVLSAAVLILSALSVIILIGALSPHLSMDAEKLEEEKELADKVSAPPSEVAADDVVLSEARKNKIAQAIRKYIEGEKAYLDSHLTIFSLAKGVGENRTHVSVVMSERFGGFFSYVNRCRIAHAARLKVENPDISLSELATASGFTSRQSYLSVRRQLEM